MIEPFICDPISRMFLGGCRLQSTWLEERGSYTNPCKYFSLLFSPFELDTSLKLLVVNLKILGGYAFC